MKTRTIYDTLLATSRAVGETNDCAVIAIAAATGTTYNRAHDALERAGRRTGRGSSLAQISAALGALGHVEECGELNPLDDGKERVRRIVKRKGGNVTVATITRYLSRTRRYVCWTRNHCFAVVDGQVEDWTDGRRHVVRGALVVSTQPSPHENHQ